ncbi:hypothetical protein [Ectobacillus panaciterrae]|uniref:hypothetical protein n=1 Tax=Ectobacillus panaciterrae TaxID=363872 RepID=UPI0003F86E5F|nr:hypothetical protein [Ectobacillus panaciterrae]
MKRIGLLLAFVCFTILAGCDDTMRYAGESKHWKGTLMIIQSEDSERREGYILYKGKDRGSIKHVQWRVTDGIWESNGNMPLDNGRINLSSFCSGCATYDREEPFTVTVEWNGKKETFQMKLKRKE